MCPSSKQNLFDWHLSPPIEVLKKSPNGKNKMQNLRFDTFWRSKVFHLKLGFRSLTLIKNQNKIIVDDGGYPMSHCYNGAHACFFSDSSLNHIVCCRVYWCCGLIQNQYFPPLQQHPSKTHKLPLSHTPVFSIFFHWANSPKVSRSGR